MKLNVLIDLEKIMKKQIKEKVTLLRALYNFNNSTLATNLGNVSSASVPHWVSGRRYPCLVIAELIDDLFHEEISRVSKKGHLEERERRFLEKGGHLLRQDLQRILDVELSIPTGIPR